LEAKKKEVNAAVGSSGPTTTLRPTHSPKQGKSTKEDEIDEDETTYDPIDKRTEVTPRDSSLFYSNGNPKPISAGWLLIQEPKSRQAKRPGRRRKGRRGDQIRGGPAEDLGEPSPEITDRDKTETEPVHVPKADRVKMIVFSLLNYVASLKTKKLTHNTHQYAEKEWTEPQTQHKSTESRNQVAEPGFTIGAACFEPGTALLLQNPLDQDTQTLTKHFLDP